MYLKQPMLTVIFPFAMARKVAEDLVVALRRRAEQESEAHAACLRELRSLEFAEKLKMSTSGACDSTFHKDSTHWDAKCFLSAFYVNSKTV